MLFREVKVQPLATHPPTNAPSNSLLSVRGMKGSVSSEKAMRGRSKARVYLSCCQYLCSARNNENTARGFLASCAVAQLRGNVAPDACLAPPLN